MKMKTHTDWTDEVRSALRDAEVRPSEGGWERLQRELDTLDPKAAGTSPHVPESLASASRRTGWRIYGPRIAAAAAVLLLGIVGGELLWRAEPELGGNQEPVLATVTEAGDSATGRTFGTEPAAGQETARQPIVGTAVNASADAARKMPEPTADGARTSALQTGQQGGESAELTLRERLSEASGWSQTPTGDDGTESRTEMMAQVTPHGESSEPISGSAANDRSSNAQPDPSRGGAVNATARAAQSDHDGTDTSEVQPDRDGKAASAVQSDRDGTATRGTQPDRTVRRAKQASGTSRTAARRAILSDDPFADPTAGSNPSERTSLALFAGGGMTGSSAMGNTPLRSYSVTSNEVVSIVGNGNNFSPMLRRDYDQSSFRHHLPLSFGFTVRREFPYDLSLESGVVYTLLWSDVRLRYSSEDVSQKLHFIGIPLRMNWQFVEQDRFSSYVGAGGMVEKCISARFGSETLDEGTLQWSVAAALGVQYRLVDQVGLYFEPEVSYYLSDTQLRTSRSDAPLSLTLRLGVRVLF